MGGARWRGCGDVGIRGDEADGVVEMVGCASRKGLVNGISEHVDRMGQTRMYRFLICRMLRLERLRINYPKRLII